MASITTLPGQSAFDAGAPASNQTAARSKPRPDRYLNITVPLDGVNVKLGYLTLSASVAKQAAVMAFLDGPDGENLVAAGETSSDDLKDALMTLFEEAIEAGLVTYRSGAESAAPAPTTSTLADKMAARKAARAASA